MDDSLNSSEPTSRTARRARLLSASDGGSVRKSLRERLRILTLIPLFFVASPASAIELESDSDVATAGYYQLKWENGDKEVRFEIEEADNPAFDEARELYQGRDRATVVTGRSDGIYYYRARTVGVDGSTGDWSDTVKVEIDHHPLSRALGFFSAGAIVFIAILVAILIGNRRYHIKESV
ncbi:hypothetical protein [Thiohalophilus thiocyanatoxydans]|uniref:Fibronectin type-III domain-containing protein n=1 Tax=Thiohalophilus thiocyanatoxydans TaxID=381308 RepID=A0A4R8IQD6_9GAMM|nr:hypothetical protein [Thiohalophilus thiocyanatoxydans]TDX99678.1 hypothetical protein EDC23_2465 [Thiohalophilus thiocyanatoxydans]